VHAALQRGSLLFRSQALCCEPGQKTSCEPQTRTLRPCRYRANMAHTRQSRPDSGHGFEVQVPKIFQVSLRSPPRALPIETKVEDGTSQSKSGTSVNVSNSGFRSQVDAAPRCSQFARRSKRVVPVSPVGRCHRCRRP